MTIKSPVFSHFCDPVETDKPGVYQAHCKHCTINPVSTCQIQRKNYFQSPDTLEGLSYLHDQYCQLILFFLYIIIIETSRTHQFTILYIPALKLTKAVSPTTFPPNKGIQESGTWQNVAGKSK